MTTAEFGRHIPDRQGALADSRNSGVPRTEAAWRGATPIRSRGLAVIAQPGGDGWNPSLVRIPKGGGVQAFLAHGGRGGLWVEYTEYRGV